MSPSTLSVCFTFFFGRNIGRQRRPEISRRTAGAKKKVYYSQHPTFSKMEMPKLYQTNPRRGPATVVTLPSMPTAPPTPTARPSLTTWSCLIFGGLMLLTGLSIPTLVFSDNLDSYNSSMPHADLEPTLPNMWTKTSKGDFNALTAGGSRFLYFTQYQKSWWNWYDFIAQVGDCLWYYEDNLTHDIGWQISWNSAVTGHLRCLDTKLMQTRYYFIVGNYRNFTKGQLPRSLADMYNRTAHGLKWFEGDEVEGIRQGGGIDDFTYVSECSLGADIDFVKYLARLNGGRDIAEHIRMANAVQSQLPAELIEQFATIEAQILGD